MPVDPITIHGRIKDQAGVPIKGSAGAVLSGELVDVSDPDEPVRIYPRKMTFESNDAGELTMELLPTIAADILGTAYYTIRLRAGDLNTGRLLQVYKVAIDAAGGPVQEFADLLPVNNTVITYPARGPKGEPGEPGAPGSGGDLSYTHVQDVAATTWTIDHNLGKYPSVGVVDSAGTLVEGEVRYTSTSQCVLSFSAPFAGKVYLN